MVDELREVALLSQWGLAVMLLGMLFVWQGLSGGRSGARSLVRRDVAMVDRLEGWRTFLLGLTLFGVGAAWFWDQRWLLVLSLGFGFTELHESTHVLRAWRNLAH